jgi:hypothetical protein
MNDHPVVLGSFDSHTVGCFTGLVIGGGLVLY